MIDLTTLAASGGAAGSYDVSGTDGTAASATISTARASLGAGQNRLESAINTLTNGLTNLSDAKSRIEDADYLVKPRQCRRPRS